MIRIRDDIKIHISLEAVDMRKAINGLSALVSDLHNKSPQSGHVFVFRNKSKDKVKLLFWDRNGFVLYYKRLEKGKFKFSSELREGAVEITESQLGWLFAGLDFMLMNEFSELNYETYY